MLLESTEPKNYNKMFKKLMIKLLAPVVREVLKEIKISEKKDLKLIENVVQDALLKAVNQVNARNP